MADGLNEARAMRVAEIMNDFRTILHRISQYRVNPPQGQQQATGYTVLRQCHAEAQALVSISFGPASAPGGGSPEQTKRQLQRVLLDASARRFRAQKAYLRAVAAMRWVQAQNQVLQGQQPNAGHNAALQRVEIALTAELASITDQRVINELCQRDWSAGHYLNEDPSLAALNSWIQSQH